VGAGDVQLVRSAHRVDNGFRAVSRFELVVDIDERFLPKVGVETEVVPCAAYLRLDLVVDLIAFS
jgi:hypothetical protein